MIFGGGSSVAGGSSTGTGSRSGPPGPGGGSITGGSAGGGSFFGSFGSGTVPCHAAVDVPAPSFALRLSFLLVAACGSPATAPPTRAPAPASTPSPEPDLAARLDAAFDRVLAADQVVGAVVIVARDGKTVYERAAGWADREAKLPMRVDTQLRIASMTKPIVSATALALVDRGKLALEDPVTKWLPDFKPKLADGTAPTITVRHLLTHTAGLTYKFLEPRTGPYHAANVSDGIAEPALPAEVNLRRLAGVPLGYPPGTAWSYSLATDVLGEVVARAGGESLPAVVKHLVTTPLGMSDTVFSVTDRARIAVPYADGKPPVRMTEPHDLAQDGIAVRFSPARIFDSASYPSGGAGMAGTARDYLRFCEMLRTGGAPVLAPASARAMTENQIGEMKVEWFGPGSRFGYGVGIVTDAAANPNARGTGAFGWSGIYGTTFWVDPEARTSVVILTNTAGDEPLAKAIEQALYD
jgi:CubicO group peptidase (beta-lactamase class C family)